MAIEISYSEARNNLASLLDRVTDDREVAVIKRRGRESVAIVSESELSGLLETAHLLRSPRNAERLTKALEQMRDGGGEITTIEQLRREFGAEKSKATPKTASRPGRRVSR